MARFHVQNEFAGLGCRIAHLFLCQRAASAAEKDAVEEVVRGIFHGAVRVYLDRFLNIPPARLPRGGAELVEERFRDDYLQLLDNQQQVDEAGRRVYAYLKPEVIGGPYSKLSRNRSSAKMVNFTVSKYRSGPAPVRRAAR